jgi:hypothetical protein
MSIFLTKSGEKTIKFQPERPKLVTYLRALLSADLLEATLTGLYRKKKMAGN